MSWICKIKPKGIFREGRTPVRPIISASENQGLAELATPVERVVERGFIYARARSDRYSFAMPYFCIRS